MPLRLHPTKIKNTLYLRVPRDLARLGGIDKTTEFELDFEKANSVRLIYTALSKPTATEPENPRKVSGALPMHKLPGRISEPKREVSAMWLPRVFEDLQEI